jgi:hypothetical protein
MVSLHAVSLTEMIQRTASTCGPSRIWPVAEVLEGSPRQSYGRNVALCNCLKVETVIDYLLYYKKLGQKRLSRWSTTTDKLIFSFDILFL